MAFTVTVIDRDDLEIMAGRTCDTPPCDTGTFETAPDSQAGDAATVQLSPLED
jgi:hypothetical protein